VPMMDVSRQTRNVTSVRLPSRVKSFGPLRYCSDGIISPSLPMPDSCCILFAPSSIDPEWQADVRM
jgi:hypothetical protein